LWTLSFIHGKECDVIVSHQRSFIIQSLRKYIVTEQDDSQPELMKDWSFIGMVSTQFLGAFNDNLFKQLMLLLAIPIAGVGLDKQGIATAIFSLPFILFSGYAGFLSDRHSKRPIIIMSKVAEIAVMLMGLLGFFFFAQTGYSGLLVVLFLMGTQSAFFGPGKYGILPEMLRERDLPRANGIMVMTTFLAIIFGQVVAGLFKEKLIDSDAPAHLQAIGLWKGSVVCVVIGIVGTIAPLWIRKVKAAQPGLKFQFDALTIPKESRELLKNDRLLLLALIGSSMFWLVGAMAPLAVNSLGKLQLELNDFWTSLMPASIGVGIAVGAVIAGRLSQGKADFRVARLGLWGIAITLLLMSIAPKGNHFLGYGGSLITLGGLGISAGMFAVPVQVFIQSRPPADQKGRMIAVMNLMNFTAMLIAGLLYQLFNQIVNSANWPRSALFLLMAVLLVPLLILFRRSATDGTLEQGE